MFVNIECIIDVKLKEIEQISDSMTKFTFDCSTFNKDDKKYVEEFVEGIGGKII